MPLVSVYMIRCSLVWLVVVLFSGSMILLNKAFLWLPSAWLLFPVHVEAALFGWLVQFVAGTAFWIFPRHLTGPERGDSRPAVWMAVLLNAGVLAAGAGLAAGSAVVGFGGRLLLFAAAVLFIRLMWPRVVSYRDHEK